MVARVTDGMVVLVLVIFLAARTLQAHVGENPRDIFKGEKEVNSSRIIDHSSGIYSEPDKVAGRADFPWQVRLVITLLINNELVMSNCGGSIIYLDWIMTAAHCLANKHYLPPVKGIKVPNGYSMHATRIEIYAGITDLKDIENKKHYVKKIIYDVLDIGFGFEKLNEVVFIHKDYNTKLDGANDIALIKLTNPLTLSKTVRPIELATDEDYTTGKMLTASGWGRMQFAGLYDTKDKACGPIAFSEYEIAFGCDPKSNEPCCNTKWNLCGIGESFCTCGGDCIDYRILEKEVNPNELRYLKDLELKTINECNAIFPKGYQIGDEKICYKGRNKIPYKGDSGGPLVIERGNLNPPAYVLVGVLSSANPLYWGTAVSVSKLLPWIDGITGHECPEAQGFTRFPRTQRCFKLFTDVDRNWKEAKQKCQDENLIMVKTYDDDAVIIRDGLYGKYGHDGRFAWLGAKFNGKQYEWNDGEMIANNNKLWYNGYFYQSEIGYCALLLNDYQHYIQYWPSSPYYRTPCSETKLPRKAFCEYVSCTDPRYTGTSCSDSSICPDDLRRRNGYTGTGCSDVNWSEIVNACIKSNNYKTYKASTIDICKKKCVEEKGIICQSIEYSSLKKKCHISKATSDSKKYRKPCYLKGWVFAEIKLNTGVNWSDIVNACIRSNNYKTYTTSTIDMCKEKCVEEKGINCQSIEYSSTENMCSISTARSDSKDYIKPCFVKGWVFAEIEVNKVASG